MPPTDHTTHAHHDHQHGDHHGHGNAHHDGHDSGQSQFSLLQISAMTRGAGAVLILIPLWLAVYWVTQS